MVKNNSQKPSKDEDEVDIFAHIAGEDSPDILITSEESITVTLFEDEPVAEGEDEDDFETSIFTPKKKAKPNEDDEDNDFDSYFFEVE